MCDLNCLADLASILTAVIAAGAAVYYWCDKRSKRKRFEEYLKAESQNPDNHSHTVIHLMARLGMTEPEILHASFASKHIVHKIRKDYETGLASQLLFAYSNEKKKQ